MKQLLKTAAEHPWIVASLLAVLTALAGWQLPQLRVQISAESMLERDSLAWRYFAEAQQAFGGEDAMIIFLRDPALFEPHRLEAIQQLVDDLQALPFVSRASSLFSVANLKAVDGFIHTRPFLDPLPTTPEQRAQIWADAIANPLVAHNLISTDGQSLAVNVFFDHMIDPSRFDRLATDTIEQLITPLRDVFAEAFQIGMPAIRTDLTQKILADQRVFVPLSVLVLLCALAITLRRGNAALIPLCTAGLSVVWTLGFLAAWQIPINIMTSIVPALVIIIGSTEDVHLLAEYSAGIRQGMSRPHAVMHMADKMGMAVALTFLTTYLGFLSIALNDIELLYQFGLAASTGLLFNFIITVLLVPVVLRYLGHQRSDAATRQFHASFQRLAIGLMLRLRRYRVAVFLNAAALAVLSLWSATQLQINNNFLDYLDEHATLRAHAERVHTALSGIHTFSIYADSGIDNTFLQTRYLREIRKIQRHIEQTGVFDRSYSFVDFVALLNNVMEDGDVTALDLPESDDILREYMLFVDPSDVANYVSSDFDRARILVRHNVTSSAQLNRAVEELRGFVDENVDPSLHIEIIGKAILANKAVEAMVWGQLQSLLLVGVVIVVLVSVLFVSLRAGLIALIPNLLSVGVLFGVMALADIPLNAGTSIIAAIALGICVDDTMHVMTRFHEELKARIGRKAALVATLKAEAVPIFATSIALAAGFLVFATSSFAPVVHFGLLSAMVILVALLATFVLTPLLLGSTALLTVWDLLSYRIQNSALRDSPLFAGMSAWQVKKLLLASEVRRYPVDALILEEGREGSEMFVILDGSVEARKTHPDGSVDHLRRMRVGELFGEVAPLSGCRRTADVVAIEETRTLILSWRRIERLTHVYPLLAFRLFRNLTRIIGARLTQTTEYRIDQAKVSAADTEVSGSLDKPG